MDIKKDTHDIIEGKKSFWFSERIIFLATIVSFFVFAFLLLITEHGNSHALQKSFLDMLFDSVSVGTLTGLFRGDSGTFTFGGQFVLLLDMVMNGLMASVISVLLILFVRLGFDRKESLRTELEKMGLFTKNTLLFVLFDFVFIWGLGTLLFLFAGSRNLWEAIFNSSSHILNDGVTSIPGNMIPFRENFVMLLSGAFLITIGGLGIGIRAYFYKIVLRFLNLKTFAKYIPDALVAPKNFLIAVIAVTLILQIFGAVTMFAFDGNNTKIFDAVTPPTVKILNTYYMSVSARTAGFTTFADLSQLTDKSSFVLMFLMGIGASSSSFAGGVFKLTAFIYIFMYLISYFRGKRIITSPHERIRLSERTAIEANFRIIGFSIALFVVTLLLLIAQPNISGLFLLFEAISGVSNTGLTLGATSLLNAWGMILIIILMTMGKLGFITTVISFFPKYQKLIETAQTDFDEFPVD